MLELKKEEEEVTGLFLFKLFFIYPYCLMLNWMIFNKKLLTTKLNFCAVYYNLTGSKSSQAY